MGRWTTGAITTGEAIRIELSNLIKNGYIQKNQKISASLTWTNGSAIGFESYYTSDEAYIRLHYSNTNKCTNEVTSHDYKIQLTTIPSNLGKGEVLYFVCPQSGRNCRILYKCYQSTIWKSRFAYQNRIYYQSQLSSKNDFYNDKYWRVNKLLKEIKKPVKSHYKSKKTRLQQRVEYLQRQLYYFDEKRFEVYKSFIQKIHSKSNHSRYYQS